MIYDFNQEMVITTKSEKKSKKKIKILMRENKLMMKIRIKK